MEILLRRVAHIAISKEKFTSQWPIGNEKLNKVLTGCNKD